MGGVYTSLEGIAEAASRAGKLAVRFVGALPAGSARRAADDAAGAKRVCNSKAQPPHPHLTSPLSHIAQISNHLEANSTGSWGQPSWYQAPAAAPVPESGAKRSREPDKSTSLGADDSTGACFRGLSGGDDDADDADDPPIADDAPPPVLRRTGALWPADWKP